MRAEYIFYTVVAYFMALVIVACPGPRPWATAIIAALYAALGTISLYGATKPDKKSGVCPTCGAKIDHQDHEEK